MQKVKRTKEKERNKMKRTETFNCLGNKKDCQDLKKLKELNSELLEACLNAVGAYEIIKISGLDSTLLGYEHCVKRLKQVIAKAEGEKK